LDANIDTPGRPRAEACETCSCLLVAPSRPLPRTLGPGEGLGPREQNGQAT
jgi:hypothetical protein